MSMRTIARSTLQKFLSGAVLGTGVLASFFVAYAFSGPTSNPGDPGFQSSIAQMLTKTGGTFNRDTMSLEAIALTAGGAGGVVGGWYGDGYKNMDTWECQAIAPMYCAGGSSGTPTCPAGYRVTTYAQFDVGGTPLNKLTCVKL